MRFEFYENAPKELVSVCNLCEGNAFVLIATKDRYGLEAPSVMCAKCGLVFLALRMTKDAYREFYEQGHYRRLVDQYRGEPHTLERIESGQKRYAEALSRLLSDFMGPYRSGLLLDVGGSTGVVADTMAHDYDLDATVLEPSAAEAQRARDKGLTVIQKPLDDYKPNGSRYDIVLLCQSVDHLLDIKGGLRKIRGAMRDGGLFFVDWVKPGLGMKIDHPYYLVKQTMRRFLYETGFESQIVVDGLDVRHMSIIAEAV